MIAETTIRKAKFAGPYSFYTNDRKKLAIEIQNYLNNVKLLSFPRQPIGLITPHAGYLYSGQTAAYAYKQIINYKYNRIIVLAPSHKAKFPGASVFPGKAYETPLGEIGIDISFCKMLQQENGFIIYDSYAEESEHSLEVQLPFLQKVHKDFKLVPILISDQGYENCKKISERIFKILKSLNEPNIKTLFVATSDLFHGPGSDKCNKADEELIETMVKYDPLEFNKRNVKKEIMACGYGPITILMMVTQQLSCENIEILHHTNSVESADGPEDYVVGYLAACIY